MRQSACDGVGGQWHGDYLVCEVVECPQPPNFGACCVIESCFETFEASCAEIQGRWEGDLTQCSKTDCSLPPDNGACCVNGSCVEVTLDGCYEASGSYAGDLTECDNIECVAFCYGDVNSDGLVNITDVLAVIAVWGVCP